uniref:Reverse transcriptase Ty1/copia-type domain-containing protein n=1 Tax=Opuntia streptacantha TaxID=393608 RepID=A0A7C8YTF6_OPUST
MTQPQGFVHPDCPHHVCKLLKFLYGIKQAPRAWFHKFSDYLQSLGFSCTKADSSMFIYCTSTILIMLLLYVDEIIITGSSSSFVLHIIHLLSVQFPMKDIGDLYYFLRVQVVRTPDGLFISQNRAPHIMGFFFDGQNLCLWFGIFRC